MATAMLGDAAEAIAIEHDSLRAQELAEMIPKMLLKHT